MSGTCDDGEIQDLENALEVTNLELIARCAELDALKQEVERLREQVLVASRVNTNLEQMLSEREGMLGLLADVAEFHNACGQPVLTESTVPSEERVRLRLDLIREEFFEVLGSTLSRRRGSETYEQYWGYAREELDAVMSADVDVDLEGLADGLADLIYVCVGAAHEFGIPLDRVWREVQRSNMAKVGPDGEVKLNAAGKIQKPDRWTPPDIRGAIYGDCVDA